MVVRTRWAEINSRQAWPRLMAQASLFQVFLLAAQYNVCSRRNIFFVTLYVDLYVYLCIHVYMYVCISMYPCIYVCIGICVCMRVGLHGYACVCVRV
jgi:hypothetical protein